jgi:hypothetical protein
MSAVMPVAMAGSILAAVKHVAMAGAIDGGGDACGDGGGPLMAAVMPVAMAEVH